MGKPYVTDFISWGLSHAKREDVPSGALLPVPLEKVGTDPWHYLMGTIMNHTTPALIEERWRNYYSSHGWTETRYRKATNDFKPTDYATDCQGHCDAWWTYVYGEKTDINANMNYEYWCTDKGKVNEIDRPYVIGEAVFIESVDKQTGIKRKTHVGFVCGLTFDGMPLVLEARGLAYGVVITEFEGRGWTHRGLMTVKFDYSEKEVDDMNYPETPIVFAYTSPIMRGEAVRILQRALNNFGYKDANGMTLEDDGKCGKRTMEALTAFVEAHRDLIEPIIIKPEPEPVETNTITLYFGDEQLYSGEGFVLIKGE